MVEIDSDNSPRETEHSPADLISAIPASDSVANNRIALCIAIHVAVDFLIVRNIFILDKPLNLVLLGWAMGQVSLVASWVAASHRHLATRSAIMMLAALAVWFLIVFINGSSTGLQSAYWGIALVTQIAVVTAVINLRQRLRARRRGEPSPFGIDLQSLMILTAVCAVGFGCFQMACSQWNWRLNFSTPVYVVGTQLIGALNGWTAITALWIVSADNYQNVVMRIVVGSISLAPLITLVALIIMTTEKYRFTTLCYATSMLTFPQLVFLAATLLLAGSLHSRSNSARVA